MVSYIGESLVSSSSSGKMSKEVIESYVFAEARRGLGVYAERLFLRLTESAQKYLYGLNFKDGSGLRQVEVGPWGEAAITIPVRDLLFGDDDHNYDKAKEGVRELMSKFLEFDDGERYHATQILNEVDISSLSGRVVIEVNRNIWRAMLDFSRGYRLVDLETAFKLRGKYALRLFPFICHQERPLTYTLDALREMWCLKDKYPKTKDFLRNTLSAAKEEFDRVSPWTFDYTLNYARSGRGGRPSVVSVTLHPVYRVTREAPKRLVQRVAPSMILSQEELTVLKEVYGFTSDGLSANLPLFDLAKRSTDLPAFLRVLKPAATRARSPQGYVVGALRKHLKDMGVDPDGE